MADFPSNVPKPSNVNYEIYLPQIKTEFEANYQLRRRKVTRERRIFALEWSLMRRTDLSIVEAFFIANQGTGFNWTNPLDGKTYVVGFAENSFAPKTIDRNSVSLTFSLEEN